MHPTDQLWGLCCTSQTIYLLLFIAEAERGAFSLKAESPAPVFRQVVHPPMSFPDRAMHLTQPFPPAASGNRLVERRGSRSNAEGDGVPTPVGLMLGRRAARGRLVLVYLERPGPRSLTTQKVRRRRRRGGEGGGGLQKPRERPSRSKTGGGGEGGRRKAEYGHGA